MKDPKKPTRANNRSTNSKEQTLTRKITIALVVILILSLLFLAYTIFGGGGEEDENSFLDTSSESSSVISESSEEESSSESSSESESSDSSESSESSSAESSEEESPETESDETASGEWDPVGTEQSGEHTTNYSEGSQDRIEIKRASSVATGISEGDMIEWWVGNAGDQQVETTISNSAQTVTYRVLLRWVDNQGWQPMQVEELSDNPYN